MILVCVNSIKSMGYGMICVRHPYHIRRHHEVIFHNDFSTLNATEQLGALPPYYVWDGHPPGLASHPMRKGLARGPP